MTCCILSHHLFSCLPRCQTTLKQPGSHQCIILKLWLRYHLLGHIREININLTHKFGTEHLRSYAMHMAPYNFLNLHLYARLPNKDRESCHCIECQSVMAALVYVADRTFTLMTSLGLWLVRSECSLCKSWQCMTNCIHIMESAHWSCFPFMVLLETLGNLIAHNALCQVQD